MTCPRLTTELATLKRISSHWTVDEIERRIVDHQRHCAGCNGWTYPPHLPRDPLQETP